MQDYSFQRSDFSYNSPLRSKYAYQDYTKTPDPPRYNTPYTYDYSTPQTKLHNYRNRYFQDSPVALNSQYAQPYRGVRTESASPGNRQTAYNRYPYQTSQYSLTDYTDIDCIIEPVGGKGGLYLGNINGAKNIQLLRSKQIGAVVTLLANSGIRYSPQEINHYVIEIDDAEDANIQQHFDSAVSFIQQQLSSTNVFVHCYAGISRSSSIVIAYIMNKNKCNFNKAFQHVKSRRKIIDPNNGFVMQLKQYEQKFNSLSNYNCCSQSQILRTSYDWSYQANAYNRFQY